MDRVQRGVRPRARCTLAEANRAGSGVGRARADGTSTSRARVIRRESAAAGARRALRVALHRGLDDWNG